MIYRVSATSIEMLTVKHYRQRLIDRARDFQHSDWTCVGNRPTYGAPAKRIAPLMTRFPSNCKFGFGHRL